MISIKVNEKDINIPIGWSEVSTELYQKLKSVDEPTVVKLFAVICGMKDAEIADAKNEELEMMIYNLSSFVFSDEYFRYYKTPDYITIDGKDIQLPKNLESMTIEQNLIVRQRLSNCKFLEELIAFCTAIYLQPKIDNSIFNQERAKEIESRLLQMPIDQVFPIGFFLLNRLKNSGKSGQMRWLLTRLLLMNLYKKWQNKQKLKNWKGFLI